MGSDTQLAYVGQGDLVVGLWPELVSLSLHASLKSQCPAVTMSDTLVNGHTHADAIRTVCMITSAIQGAA